MFQIVFVFIAAALLEILGAYMAIVGLSSKKSGIIMVLALTLDFAKIVIATILYKNWHTLGLGFKLYLVPTLLFLIFITSYGAYAYLIQEFKQTIQYQQKLTIQLQNKLKEQEVISGRLEDINKQIAKVPPGFTTQKRRLKAMFQEELEFLNQRSREIRQAIPKLETQLLASRNQDGTIGSLSQSWGVEPEQVIRFIALALVFVIDPLAIILVMIGNFLLLRREQLRLNPILKQSSATNNFQTDENQQQNITDEIPEKNTAGTHSTEHLKCPMQNPERPQRLVNKLVFPNKPIMNQSLI